MTPERSFSLAMAVGVVVGLLGLVVDARPRALPLPDDAIARVDGQLIARSEYERAIAALEADLRRPLDAGDHRRVLERLVDEQLLVEHALALDLARRDPYLRTWLARAVLDRVQAEVALADPPSEAELLEHYAAHPERFAATDRISLRSWWFDSREQAEQARARMRAGLPIAGEAPDLALPDTPLSPAKLRDYLGAGAAEQALALDVGQVSEPILVDEGAWLLECSARTPGRPLPFATARARVEADLRRTREDRALAQLLERLRGAADITLAEPR